MVDWGILVALTRVGSMYHWLDLRWSQGRCELLGRDTLCSMLPRRHGNICRM